MNISDVLAEKFLSKPAGRTRVIVRLSDGTSLDGALQSVDEQSITVGAAEAPHVVNLAHVIFVQEQGG
ncbi:MAG: hypothetical protein JWP97_5412 [Labilithrix sp.]|nr:hypothetical protein [Labilithrix sp.]